MAMTESLEGEITRALQTAYVQGLREGIIQGVSMLEAAIEEVEKHENFKPPGSL